MITLRRCEYDSRSEQEAEAAHVSGIEAGMVRCIEVLRHGGGALPFVPACCLVVDPLAGLRLVGDQARD